MTTYIDLKKGTNIELLDEDNMSSNSATKGATQQSIKAYVDALPTGGGVVQQVYAETATTASFSTAIPLDDTIPQNTEGTEQVTVAITPTNASNILIIEAVFQGSNSTGSSETVLTICQDSVVNAIHASHGGTEGGQDRINHRALHRMVAGTTSSTTFKMRFGTSTGTCYRNANFAGTRMFGGIMQCYIKVTEIEV